MMAHRPQTPRNRDDIASGSAELESVDHGHDRRSGEEEKLSGCCVEQ